MSECICGFWQEEIIFSTWLFRDLGSFNLVAITFCKALKSSAGYFCIQVAEREQRKQEYGWFCGQFFSGPRFEVIQYHSHSYSNGPNSVIWPPQPQRKMGNGAQLCVQEEKKTGLGVFRIISATSLSCLPGEFWGLGSDRHGFRSWLCHLLSWESHLSLF